nr:PREDICTED: uncharacterized protein C6orf229 homolog [Pelecanus crispus]
MKNSHDLFCTQSTSTEVRIQLLKGLSCLCYLTEISQEKAQDLNLTSILLDHLDENKEQPDADNACKFWNCYFLAVLCSNNSTCITAVHRAGGEVVEKLHLLSQLDWSAWPANYTTALSSLLQSLAGMTVNYE